MILRYFWNWSKTATASTHLVQQLFDSFTPQELASSGYLMESASNLNYLRDMR